MTSDEGSSPVRELTVTQIDLDLFAAVKGNDAAAVLQNIQNGANVNCIHSEGSHKNIKTTPLMKACQRGYDEIVRMLLDAGACPRWRRYGGDWSAIESACFRGNLSLVEMLINHDNSLLEPANKTLLLCAIREGHVEIVRFLIDRGVNVHAREDETTTLMTACERNGDLEIMRMLLAAGVDVEARDTSQRTALHHAAWKGKLEAVQELVLQHDANMCALNSNQDTPFDDALITIFDNDAEEPNYFDVLDSLLEMYGNRLTQDHGRLAFHAILLAAKYSFPGEFDFYSPVNGLLVTVPLGKLTLPHLRTLLHSLDTELIRNRDHSGKLPIHIACQTKAPVDVLAMLGQLDMATLHMADHRGNLALHECCHGEVDHSSVLFLVKQGGVGTLTARNHQGALSLHVLCGSSHPSWRTVQYLIQSFPGSVEARTNTGQYPFMIAASENSTASLSVIYELARASPGLMVPRQIING